MNSFAYVFRYIDNLCWLNTWNAQIFLDPLQSRTISNPYWIYPLHILDIKLEILDFSKNNALHGIKTHFMNVLISISDENLGILMLQRFDKIRDLPFTYTQNIRVHSNRPVKQTYNVIVLQTFPIFYLSNDIHLALHEINNLIFYLNQ